MDQVYMLSPDGSQQKLVPAVPEELVPLMIRGWRQVDPPEPPKEPSPEDQE